MVLVTVVVCGAPLAARAADVVRYATEVGWEVEVLATPAADSWLRSISEKDSEFAARTLPMPSDQMRSYVPRSAVIAVPITFNSISKLANGIADTHAHSVLCECLGAGLPFVMVPMVNGYLRKHPSWRRNVECLIGAGVLMVDPATGNPCHSLSDLSERMDITSQFDAERLVETVANMLQ